jgi:DNA-binding transcriptional ArsR family regulator
MAERKPSQPLQFYRLNTAPVREITQSNDCVVALRALGESTRARIIGMLLKAPLDVGEISKRVGMSQYNTSKHLRILREAGLLEVDKQGRRRLYALPDTIRRQVARRSVLDLGCCSFRFEQAPVDTTIKSRARRRPSAGRPRRLAR